MTRKEIIYRNIGLAFDLLKEINSNTVLLSKIPKGATIEFVEKDFPKKEPGASRRRNRKYVQVKNNFELG